MDSTAPRGPLRNPIHSSSHTLPAPSATRSLRDNTYVGTFGAAGWGARANDVLSKVRGKDFRHEKTKKKRGSYRGGAIELGAVHSTKLGSEDD